MVVLSLDWESEEGLSVNQCKIFKDVNAAFEFCKKNIETIARINNYRFKSSREHPDTTVEKISDSVIFAAIIESCNTQYA